MKKTLAFMVMALALLLTQCKKPSIKFPTPSVTTTVSMTITAGPGSKTDISTEGGIVWSENDKIYVGDGAKCIGSLSIVSGVGNATGTFTGDVTATTGTHTFHFYYLGSTAAPAANATEVTVDFSSQDIYADGGKIKNASGQHVGYGKAENVTVEAGQPVTGLQVNMKSKVAIAYFCFQKGEGEGATQYTGALTLSGDHIYNKMTVKFDASDFYFTPVKDGDISLANTTTHLKYAMLVPAGTSAATLNFGGGAEGTTTLENGIEANRFYRIDGNMPIVVKVKGSFTVDEYGTTVEFSPGNLYYNGANDSKMNSNLPSGWNFYGHQWDCYPSGTSSVTESMEISLFTWGYGTWSTVYNTQTCQQGTGVTMTDWGSVAIGSDPANTWRTLSGAEWNYLLGYDPEKCVQTPTYGRPNAMNLCAGKELDGGTHNGVVILPDGTDASVMSSITSVNDLASSGAVFLPAAGYRKGTDVRYVGSRGDYWSSTPRADYSACYMYYDSGLVGTSNYNRNYSYAVRLVR